MLKRVECNRQRSVYDRFINLLAVMKISGKKIIKKNRTAIFLN